MKNTIFLLFICCLFILPLLLSSEVKPKELIQVAILLDTSNSMDGLIEQAKSQLWKIVNELSLTKKNGMAPRIEVALYEYGNDNIPAGEGYVRMRVALSTDLDKVSDELFKLTTNGGDEYCGKVIKVAVQGLKWSKKNKDLKLIFIAGNEPFTQGKVNYETVCRDAIKKGIIVNTIFCGSFQEGVNTKWKHGADLADGKYMNIDQNIKIVDIQAPQDDELVKLGQELNKTYIAYGQRGEMKKEMQAKQDANAESISPQAMAQRSITKASLQYDNASWDLVDALKSKSIKVEELKESELPSEMQNMTKEARKEYIQKMQLKRDELQKKINSLNKARREYVDKERKKMATENTLDEVMLKTIKDQATKKGFK